VEDSVAGLQVLTARQSLHLRFAEPVAAEVLAGVAGVQEVDSQGTRVAVVIQGSVRPLVEALAGLPIEHISADPLLLDDLFYGIYDAADDGVGVDGGAVAGPAASPEGVA